MMILAVAANVKFHLEDNLDTSESVYFYPLIFNVNWIEIEFPIRLFPFQIFQ